MKSYLSIPATYSLMKPMTSFEWLKMCWHIFFQLYFLGIWLKQIRNFTLDIDTTDASYVNNRMPLIYVHAHTDIKSNSNKVSSNYFG